MGRLRKGDAQAAKSLRAVAERFKKFRPAPQVLTPVKAVPTRFIQLDHATRVGGWPIERYALVHGRSNEGKSLFTLGLVDSFLAGAHFALYVDAERTTPITWVKQLLAERAEHPYFFAYRPESYEKTIDHVRNWLNTVIAARKAGDVPPDTAAIVVVDSLRKLVPADLMKEILKQAKEEAEAAAKGKPIKTGRDRGAQQKARMNAAWCDELTPQLEAAQANFTAIAREMLDPDADRWAKERGDDYKVGGGSATYYDAAIVARVERASWVGRKAERDESGRATKPGETYGERHLVTIRKTKVAVKDDRVVRAYFHSSNGQHTPFGFDRGRDVLELALRFGVAERRRAAILFGGEIIAKGGISDIDHSAARRLSDDPGLLLRLEERVREVFANYEPQPHDADGVVQESA